MLKKYFRWKLVAVALECAFAFSFFIGLFSHSPVRMQQFEKGRWFYINRGYPAVWAGVTKAELSVDFPIIKAPLLVPMLSSYSNTSQKFAKVIDLRYFLPLFLVVFLASYPFIYVIYRGILNEKSLNVLLAVL